jgi:DNA-binding MarR family transcriptional regulator
MTATELGEKTLITKGTLTGVVDRLVDRGWVERAAHGSDRRCQVIRLTPAGDTLFAKAFPEHMAHVGACFAGASAADHTRWQTALRALEQAFRKEAE